MMDKKKRVLVTCLADPTGNPRPRRAIELCLSMGMSVSVLSYSPKIGFPFNIESFFGLSSLSSSFFAKVMRRVLALFIAACPFESGKNLFESLRLGFYGLEDKLLDDKFDLIIVENIELLPLVFKVKGDAKVIFDAREYYPREFESSLWFRCVERSRRIELCDRYMRECDSVVTVSEGLRKAFKNDFKIESILYRSVPSYVDIRPNPTDEQRIRMVYHGLANRDRQLENLISVLKLLDLRFSLDLFLVGNPGYQGELRRHFSDEPRVRFMDPVPFESIVSVVNNYDIGLFYCEPFTFNLKHCLPNKIFEYIQARVMVAIGPSPDMAQLIEKYGCGVVSKAFTVESMAEALNGLSSYDIDNAKKSSDAAAKDLCFEKESCIMKDIIWGLIGNEI